MSLNFERDMKLMQLLSLAVARLHFADRLGLACKMLIVTASYVHDYTLKIISLASAFGDSVDWSDRKLVQLLSLALHIIDL